MGTLEEATASTRIILRAGVLRGPRELGESPRRPIEGRDSAEAAFTANKTELIPLCGANSVQFSLVCSDLALFKWPAGDGILYYAPR